MSLGRLVEVSAELAQTSSRKAKTARVAELLREVPEVDLAACYLAGELPLPAPLGVGYATLASLRQEAVEKSEPVSLSEIQAVLEELSQLRGPGSQGQRKARLGALLAHRTATEQDFLVRLITGELRQGALAGVVLEALAQAFERPLADLRQALTLCGSLRRVARLTRTGRLQEVRLELFRPLSPMLASPCEGFAEAFERYPRLSLEYKMDGARVQVHRQGEQVRIYSRGLNDVTESLPEVVEEALRYPARNFVLDGETLALDAAGKPLPFQDSMRRFGRKTDVDALRGQLPLTTYFFDLLHLDDETLLGRGQLDRWQALEALGASRAPRLLATCVEEAERFFRQALEAGHEGIMAKALEAGYEAGGRGFSWLKVKPAHTLDLVVLAAEWGSGRRRGWLSNLHLGARSSDGWVMLGKTFKGLTDATLEWQTKRFLELEIGRDGHIVHVRPEVVVEIAFSDLQRSPRYPGGLALRFARVKRYRPDKTAAQADSFEQVLKLAPGA